MAKKELIDKAYSDGKTGDLANLLTTDKTTLVNAVNEVKNQAPTLDGKVGVVTGDVLNFLANKITTSGVITATVIGSGPYQLELNVPAGGAAINIREAGGGDSVITTLEVTPGTLDTATPGVGKLTIGAGGGVAKRLMNLRRYKPFTESTLAPNIRSMYSFGSSNTEKVAGLDRTGVAVPSSAYVRPAHRWNQHEKTDSTNHVLNLVEELDSSLWMPLTADPAINTGNSFLFDLHDDVRGDSRNITSLMVSLFPGNNLSFNSGSGKFEPNNVYNEFSTPDRNIVDMNWTRIYFDIATSAAPGVSVANVELKASDVYNAMLTDPVYNAGFKGTWQTGVDYKSGDFVTYDDYSGVNSNLQITSLFRVDSDHTSTIFTTDADSSKLSSYTSIGSEDELKGLKTPGIYKIDNVDSEKLTVNLHVSEFDNYPTLEKRLVYTITHILDTPIVLGQALGTEMICTFTIESNVTHNYSSNSYEPNCYILTNSNLGPTQPVCRTIHEVSSYTPNTSLLQDFDKTYDLPNSAFSVEGTKESVNFPLLGMLWSKRTGSQMFREASLISFLRTSADLTAPYNDADRWTDLMFDNNPSLLFFFLGDLTVPADFNVDNDWTIWTNNASHAWTYQIGFDPATGRLKLSNDFLTHLNAELLYNLDTLHQILTFPEYNKLSINTELNEELVDASVDFLQVKTTSAQESLNTAVGKVKLKEDFSSGDETQIFETRYDYIDELIKFNTNDFNVTLVDKKLNDDEVSTVGVQSENAPTTYANNVKVKSMKIDIIDTNYSKTTNVFMDITDGDLIETVNGIPGDYTLGAVTSTEFYNFNWNISSFPAGHNIVRISGGSYTMLKGTTFLPDRFLLTLAGTGRTITILLENGTIIDGNEYPSHSRYELIEDVLLTQNSLPSAIGNDTISNTDKTSTVGNTLIDINTNSVIKNMIFRDFDYLTIIKGNGFVSNIQTIHSGNQNACVVFEEANGILKIDNCSSINDGGVQPSGNGSNYNVTSFKNISNISNCLSISAGYEADLSSTLYGFDNCRNLNNCKVQGLGIRRAEDAATTSITGPMVAFHSCYNLVDCFVAISVATKIVSNGGNVTTILETSSRAFYECSKLINCHTILNKVSYENCELMHNCTEDTADTSINIATGLIGTAPAGRYGTIVTIP